jgi:hypothetical protein
MGPDRGAQIAFAAAAVSAAAVAAAALPPLAAAAVAAAAVFPAVRRAWLRPGESAELGDIALRRHLAICRRREERAAVVVASIQGRHAEIARDLRISDSAVVRTAPLGALLVAVVDGQELALARIEARLREQHPGPLAIGSAMFPDDGLTLDVLVAVASARARLPLAESAEAAEAGAAPGADEPR